VSTRYGFVGTYPPTLCGLASFTAALQAELVRPGDSACVVRLVESSAPGIAPAPIGATEIVELLAGDPVSLRAAAAALSSCDTVVLQHEYGVYGGPDGDEVLDLLAAVTSPVIVVLHTVLTDPSPHQRDVLERVARAAGAVVTMTETAAERLVGYDVDLRKVSVIPHGAPAATAPEPRDPTRSGQRPRVLTWGLLGPGKGIEWAIEAMARLADLRNPPEYVVAGQTHPEVLLDQGERYRESLQGRIDGLGLCHRVTLDGRYRDLEALRALVATADVVLLPYDSTEQVTSGVLIEAVTARKPVVATRFPHAVELLSGGAGLIVPQRDPVALAGAVRRLLSSSALTDDMRRASGATAPASLWSAVAERYRRLAADLSASRAAA